MDEAIVHCTKGIGIWDWKTILTTARNSDVVMARAGDIATMEAAQRPLPS